MIQGHFQRALRPAVVARKVTAFTSGMDRAGIGTAVKHFPGLGRVRGNTDTEPDVVDRVTGKQTPVSLTARFPHIVENMDGTPSGEGRRQTRLLIGVGAVAVACFFVIYLLLFR